MADQSTYTWVNGQPVPTNYSSSGAPYTPAPSYDTLWPSVNSSPVYSGGGVVNTGGGQPQQSTQQNYSQPAPQGVSDQEINSIYDPQMNYLNQAESQLNQDYPSVLEEARKAYETNAGLLSASKQQGQAALGENQVKAGQQKEDTLDMLRRLYSQLRQGYSQRFGGSSSAGGAASEIAGAEQQRQQGQAMRSYGDTVRQIQQQAVKIDQDYNNGLLQLEQNKQSAVAQAQRDFSAKLLEINKLRADLGTNKAQAKMEALQNLRNQVYQINMQNTQFQQALDQQKQAAQLQLQNYYATVNTGMGTGQSALNSFTSAYGGQPTSGLQVGGGNTYAPSYQAYTGQTTNKKYDQYGNPVA